MRPSTFILLAVPALSNLIPRQVSTITQTPTVLSITATVIDITETGGPFASLDTVPGCSIRPSDRRLLDSAPRPGTKLLAELTSVTNFCDFAPTGTVLSVDYSQYTSELVTWYEANSAALGSFQASFTSSCTVAQSAITSAVLACVSQITAEAASAASGTVTAATTANATKTGVSTTASAAGAERTGVAAAAGAVAGMMALIAVL